MAHLVQNTPCSAQPGSIAAGKDCKESCSCSHLRLLLLHAVSFFSFLFFSFLFPFPFFFLFICTHNTSFDCQMQVLSSASVPLFFPSVAKTQRPNTLQRARGCCCIDDQKHFPNCGVGLHEAMRVTDVCQRKRFVDNRLHSAVSNQRQCFGRKSSNQVCFILWFTFWSGGGGGGGGGEDAPEKVK